MQAGLCDRPISIFRFVTNVFCAPTYFSSGSLRRNAKSIGHCSENSQLRLASNSFTSYAVRGTSLAYPSRIPHAFLTFNTRYLALDVERVLL